MKTRIRNQGLHCQDLSATKKHLSSENQQTYRPLFVTYCFWNLLKRASFHITFVSEGRSKPAANITDKRVGISWAHTNVIHLSCHEKNNWKDFNYTFFSFCFLNTILKNFEQSAIILSSPGQIQFITVPSIEQKSLESWSIDDGDGDESVILKCNLSFL